MNFFFENSGKIFIAFMSAQILYSAILFVILFGLGFLYKKSNVLLLVIWSLIFVRLVLPPTLSSPISGRVLFATLFESNNTEETIIKFHHFSQDGSPDNFTDIAAKRYHGLMDLVSWQNILFLFWMIGVAVFTVVYIKRYRYFRKMVKRATVLSSPEFLNIVETWQKQFKVKRQVLLLSCNENVVPFTMGTLKPVICLNDEILENASQKNLHSIIAHELAHIRRFDDLFIRLQSAIQILYFFHPAVWFASNRINMARECLCDEMVISQKQISAREYATGLFQTIKLYATAQKELVPIPAFGHQHNKLKQRFHNLKGENRMKKTTTVLAVLGIAIIALTVLPMAEVTVKNNSQVIAAEIANNEAETKVTIGTDKVEKVDEIVVGRISAGFGNMIDPFTQKERFHNAIDIAAESGTTVNSYADGVVLEAVIRYEPNKGSGKYITIQHADGIQTRYAHLGTVLVQGGQEVKAGEKIGEVGSTGVSTGPHLHFELIKDGQHVDPLQYLNTK